MKETVKEGRWIPLGAAAEWHEGVVGSDQDLACVCGGEVYQF